MARTISMREAINEALDQEMARDPKVVLMGEDIVGGAGSPGEDDAWGGVLGVTKGLYAKYGRERLLDTPLSESAYIGAAIGAATCGLRPVAELMFIDFMGVCFDQIYNQAAKFRYMFGGKAETPVTIRAMVNDVGRTSMEVGVRVDAENYFTGRKVHTSSAYLVFVALDDEGKPRAVPPLHPENEEEQRRMEEAKIRRQHRLARKEAILARRPASRFEIAAASVALTAEIQSFLSGFSLRNRVAVVTGDSSGTMQRAFAGMVASGTATLESAYFRMPFVLVYKVSWPTYLGGRLLIRTRFLGMPNVLADREVVPVFLQHEARPKAIADSVLQLMNESTRREKMIADFDAIIASLGETGASEKAARAILSELGTRTNGDRIN